MRKTGDAASAGAHHHHSALQARHRSSRDRLGTDRVAKTPENGHHDPKNWNTGYFLLMWRMKGAAVAGRVGEHRRLDLELHTTTMSLAFVLHLLDVEDHPAHMKTVTSPHIDHIPSRAAGAHEAKEDPSRKVVFVKDQGFH